MLGLVGPSWDDGCRVADIPTVLCQLDSLFSNVLDRGITMLDMVSIKLNAVTQESSSMSSS